MPRTAFLASLVGLGLLLSFCFCLGSAQELSPLPELDARGVNGVREIGRAELEKLLSRNRPLTASELIDLNRGCPGLSCLYQGLGQTRWPESTRGTVAFLTLEDALKRQCPQSKENFIFLKQGCWLEDKPPTPDEKTKQVSVDSVTRTRPGFYSFNYAVYFPKTRTYAWINHREFGFPLNEIRPQTACLSTFPPPLDESRPAQIYCSTCH